MDKLSGWAAEQKDPLLKFSGDAEVRGDVRRRDAAA